MSGPPFISFLSDYGRLDEFVGVCHGVIARRCPQARVIDITHEIPRHDVRTGALVLRDSVPYMPAGVHLAIVDPGVGASGGRRGLALRAGEQGQLLVGPDNGLLVLAAERLGGIVEAVDLGRSPERLEPPSRTFHGRDIFAPVAAALSAGRPLSAVGDPLPLADLSRFEPGSADVGDGALRAHVMRADHFGNLILDASLEQLASAGVKSGEDVSVKAGGHTHHARHGLTFADVPAGELLLYEDAQRTLALAVNLGSAAERLGVGPDDELVVRKA